MEVLKGMTMRSLLQFVDSRTDEEFLTWLQSVGLLSSVRHCESCKKPMKFYKREDRRSAVSKTSYLWRCSNSRVCTKRPTVGFFHGTFFEEHKLSLKEIFIFSYYWVHGMASDRTISREFRRENGTTLASDTRSLYRKLFSTICLEYFIRNPQRIGGSNVIVEVDESIVISKRKHNVGRIPVDLQKRSRQWYFGGVERGKSTNCFIVPIPDQTAVTLCSAINRFILPGSVIMHDGHASYKCIDKMKENHEHYEVLHKYNFVSPEDSEVHTQTIESTWQKFKQANRQRGGTARHLFMNFLSEYLWFKKFQGADALYYLWKHVSEVFVCVNGEISVLQFVDTDWNYDVFV